MTYLILVREFPYVKGEYFRVDFILDSVRQSGSSAKLYACGPVSPNGEDDVVSWEMRNSLVLRLLNFIFYLLTLRSFAHFGMLLKMWPSLTQDQPLLILFYSHWTGLFLHFWRGFVGSRTKLVWDWYDLSSRMRHYRRRSGLAGRFMMVIEEKISPGLFDGLIVPTRFAQGLLRSWGHRETKIHVLGELRQLNPYVTKQTLSTRLEQIQRSEPVRIAWIGLARPYQLDGIKEMLGNLVSSQGEGFTGEIHIAGPEEQGNWGFEDLARRLSPRIRVHLHGSLSLDALDRLLASSHVAIHPLPEALFSRYIYSRKMADYLASALPVAYSAIEGLMETGESFGVPFSLEDSDSITEAFTALLTPDKYEKFLLRAWNTSRREYSEAALSEKGRALAHFLRQVEVKADFCVTSEPRVRRPTGDAR